MKFARDWPPLSPFVHGVSVVNRWAGRTTRQVAGSSPAGTANEDMDPSLVRDDPPEISTTFAGCPVGRVAQIFFPETDKTDSSASVAVDFLRAVQHKDDDASPARLDMPNALNEVIGA